MGDLVIKLTLTLIEILENIEKGFAVRKSLRIVLEKDEFTRIEENYLYLTTFEIIRKLNVIDAYIQLCFPSQSKKKRPLDEKVSLRVITYFVKYLNMETKEIEQLFSSCKMSNITLNIANITEKLLEINEKELYTNCKDQETTMAMKFFFPTWIVRKYLEQWEQKFVEELLLSQNKNLPIYIRINKLKTETKNVMEKLEKNGVKFQITPEFPTIVKILDYIKPIPQLDLFKEGNIVIQQKASSIVSIVLNPSKDDCVLDMCSSPGGKTAHIAELMENKGEIVAVELKKERVKILKERIKLLNVKNTNIVTEDARNLGDEYKNYFDKILLDAPCTGSGTFSSRPENKWRLRKDDISYYSNIQYQLLEKASKMIKKDGFIAYSTCSIFWDENYNIIKKFLEKNNSNFILSAAEPINGTASKILDYKTQEFFPQHHETEGFFIAKLKRMK